MSDFKTRLYEEREKLISKCDKLNVFLNSDKAMKIDEVQSSIMYIQFSAMTTYLACLNARIKRLSNNHEKDI